MGRHTLPSRTARAMSLARKAFHGGHNGGRPRSKAARCYCGADAIKRASERANKDGTCPAGDGHEEPCPFWRRV